MTIEQINTKIELTEAAIDLHMDGNYTIPRLINKTGKTASEIFILFPNKKAVLEFYYPSLILRYRAMIAEIPEFESYSISEKLSNFIFTLFDMMEERREFVESTYHGMELRIFSETKFHKEVKLLFKDFFLIDTKISLSAALFMGNYFYAFLCSEYLFLIKYWLTDTSEDYERSLALTDKFTAFIEEVVYSEVVDKGFDLFKFIISSAGFSRDIPFIGSWLAGEVDKQEEPNNE